MANQQTPIDIHYPKLVDWLIQRRHCKRDWGVNLDIIRRKIRSALNGIPENDEVREILDGSKVEYFQSKRIVDILKTTEADSRNIFGYYSSQKMKDWQDIVNSYERDCVYLAELCTDLIRDIKYEVPSMRQSIVYLKEEKDDAEKERSDSVRRAQQFSSERHKLAQSYGIKGDNIFRELEQNLEILPNLMSETVELAKKLDLPLNGYRLRAAEVTDDKSMRFCEMLAHVISKGNTTYYEWKHGEPPKSVEVSDKPSIGLSSGSSQIEVVDDDVIDFGEDPPSSESSSGFVHVDQSDNGAASSEEMYVKIENAESHEDDNLDKTVARGEDARPVLDHPETRRLFMCDIYELNAFYHQNLIGNQKSSGKSDTDDSSGALGGNFSKEECDSAIKSTNKIIDTFDKEDVRVLFQFKDSPMFAECVKEDFDILQRQIDQYNAHVESQTERINDYDDKIKHQEEQLKVSIYHARELQSKVETSLRELYKGRPVNVMGCV